jgi:hypothetical protein
MLAHGWYPDKMSALVVVDGHNFFNDAARELTKIGVRLDLRAAYFRDWFDFDRLIAATLGTASGLSQEPSRDLGTVIFHSSRPLGSATSNYRIVNTDAFWIRQAAMPHTSTIFFEVRGAPKGKQAKVEKSTDAGDDTAEENEVETLGRDHGMDVAIAVHLLETAARWDTAVLFSGDSDLVAAVWSLRRQGKRIFCAMPERARTSPLVQASQSFFAWDIDFLRADLSLFAFLSKDGVLDEFRHHELGRAVTSVRINGDGVSLEAAGGGSAQNTLNEMLRQARLPLYAGDARTFLHVQASRLPGNEMRIENGAWAVEGFRRHHDVFAGARWYDECDFSI